MRKLSCLLLAATIGVAACDRAPAVPQPPASEYSAARFEIAEGTKVDTVQGASITREFLRVTGVHALLGRMFIDGDFQAGGGSTAVLSEELWRSRFGADPAIIGRPVRVNGRDLTVVGVVPKPFSIPAGTEIWLPRG